MLAGADRLQSSEVTGKIDRLAVSPDCQTDLVVVGGLHGPPYHGPGCLRLGGQGHTHSAVLPDSSCKIFHFINWFIKVF